MTKSNSFIGCPKIYFFRNIQVVVILLIVMILLSSCNQPSEEHDPDFTKQWALNNDGTCSDMTIDPNQCLTTEINAEIDINYDEMWELLSSRTVKRDVVVAIIDTGIDFTSEDLSDLEWINQDEIPNNGIDDDCNSKIDDYSGWNFIRDSSQVMNEEMPFEEDHGTMIAGIIAAKKNKIGMEGVTRGEHIKLMSLKVFDSSLSEGDGRVTNIIDAIKYAERMGADICNLSFGTPDNNQVLYETIRDSRMLFVTSAGNNPGLIKINIDKKKQYPASYQLSNLITVANLGFNGELYPQSNYGPQSVDLAAPGTNIYSKTVDKYYTYSTGTSAATPYVTGVAAVLYQYMENPSPTQIKQIITRSVCPLTSLTGLVRTEGMLDAKEAILSEMQEKSRKERNEL